MKERVHHDSAAPAAPLPVVLQLGFAGSRRLLDPALALTADEAARFEAEVQQHLVAALRELPRELELSPRHFIVGVSQLAVGADTLFTHALAELGWQQRLLLPQARADFLAAVGSRGPDFTPAEKLVASALFASPHIVEETVASDAAERTQRFEDTSLQIVAEADLLVCLYRDGAPGAAGGAAYLEARALARGKPVLVLLAGRTPEGQTTWRAEWKQRQRFQRPHLPAFLGSMAALPGAAAADPATAFIERLKAHASSRSAQHSGWFKRAAFVIVGTHVAATLFSVFAMEFRPPHFEPWVLWVLGTELVLLVGGLLCHLWLHHALATPGWAMARLCAEIARSATALRGISFPLRQLDAMPFPHELRALLRTLHVLLMPGRRAAAAEPWQALRRRYVDVRLRAPGSGQVAYYRQQRERALRWNRRATRFFSIFSFVAILATATEAWLTWHGAHEGTLEAWAGVLAVWLPVAAVGAMSLAAAHDLEARAHTFEDMHGFLATQASHLDAATSYREFAALALETEVRLLGETLIWFARRSYTGVA